MVINGRRAGHSLPELIVAVTFLAATLAAVGGMGVVGGRLAGGAAARQDAVRVAEAVLDSLTGTTSVAAGEEMRGAFIVRWAPVGASGVRVTVSRADGAPLVTLSGRMIPGVPALPDEATGGSSGAGAGP